jgi:hypothetical protein
MRFLLLVVIGGRAGASDAPPHERLFSGDVIVGEVVDRQSQLDELARDRAAVLWFGRFESNGV